MTLRFTVKREPVTVEGGPDTTLLPLLRTHLDLKGGRFGCGLGLCGGPALDRNLCRCGVQRRIVDVVVKAGDLGS